MPCYDKPGFSIEDLDGVDFSSCDAGIVLGGDGTLLAAVRALSVFDIPLFGVNMGRVGFLSSTEADDALAAVDKLLAGKYIIRERLMIKAALIRQGREKSVFTAFNDFVDVYKRQVKPRYSKNIPGTSRDLIPFLKPLIKLAKGCPINGMRSKKW